MEKRNEKRSIIDIGSNTIRLVIYEGNKNRTYREIENIKTVARLRNHITDQGDLADKGIDLLLHILKGFKEVLDYHQLHTVKCVATAAIRQAVNKQEILKIVKAETGFDITILSGKEEAYYGYFAVSHTTPIDEAVTIDIGGGSTEITYFKKRKLIHSHSFPFGVVSLKEQFISGGQINATEKARFVAYIKESFQSLQWLKSLKVPIIAIGGSARNVAQIDQNLKNDPLAGIHQYTMTQKDLTNILLLVETSSMKELEKLEGLSKDRADLIQPALTVFVLLSEYVQSGTFMFSRKGLREGIFMKEYEGRGECPNLNHILNRSMDELINDYQINQKHSEQVANLTKQISTQLSQLYGTQESDEYEKILEVGAKVYYLGKYIDSDVSSQHTFYLLANKSINGITHRQRLILALVASFKNYQLFKQYIAPFVDQFSKEELQKIRIAGAITKLAASLDASKRGIIKEIYLEKIKATNGLKMTLRYEGNAFVEKYQAEKHTRQLEKAIEKEIRLIFTN
ncbi:exopolyphosphatase [Bacillus sp. B15-48]|uniref:exopolyphosphatase n=1 Tax=Bacillus sp. B15-48 TaxID=1548601 RepID=UPI00193ECB57|nr:exopolyphosphatase [Bacillus sp. B15-48]MBM4764508.1 exopolyphosphatase [Bacillus sp. B15-48]